MIDHDYLALRPMKENDVILIIGAYDGDFMRQYKDEIIDKNVFIINIEPDYRTFKSCLEYANKNLPLNAVVLNIVLSDTTGKKIFDYKNYTQLSCIRGIESVMPCDTVKSVVVLSLTLDQLLNLFPVNCIFADIEGAELEVFIPSKKVLDIDYVSIASYHIRDGKPTYLKLLDKFPTSRVLDQHEKWDSAVLYYKKGGV